MARLPAIRGQTDEQLFEHWLERPALGRRQLRQHIFEHFEPDAERDEGRMLTGVG